MGLTASLAECLSHRREAAKIAHDLKTLLAQRVFGIALGYEDLNDHATLRDDPLFAIFAEQRPGPQAPLQTTALVRQAQCRLCRGLAPQPGVGTVGGTIRR